MKLWPILCRIFGHDWSVDDATSQLSAVSFFMKRIHVKCDRCGIEKTADWNKVSGLHNFQEKNHE